jgi:AcrR family transcriptional regulator
MSIEKKKYELKARAQSQQETRERITRAAVDLHAELGVASTTVAEIARRAGVSRLTVYNHFPDLPSLLPACSAHYEQQHPFPDISAALAIEDPLDRVGEVLRLLYGWYRETETMFSKVLADRVTVPELDDFLGANNDRQLAEVATALAPAISRSRGQSGRAVLLRLALDFWTWRRLTSEGLDDRKAARLMAGVIVPTQS